MTAIRFVAAALAMMVSFSAASQDAPSAPPAKKVVLLAGATGKKWKCGLKSAAGFTGHAL